ncbi:MAG: hypothetical protein RL250_1395 [Verrucomicrobiota bacterium]|jgi:hypothetical protein
MRTLILFLGCLGLVGCNVKKSAIAGQWFSKDPYIERKIFGSDQPHVVERNLRLDQNGQGTLLILDNRKVSETINGQWAVDGDILHLDYEGGKSLYLRIVRLTDERLVIRTDEGKERIYERVK